MIMNTVVIQKILYQMKILIIGLMLFENTTAPFQTILHILKPWITLKKLCLTDMKT